MLMPSASLVKTAQDKQVGSFFLCFRLCLCLCHGCFHLCLFLCLCLCLCLCSSENQPLEVQVLLSCKWQTPSRHLEVTVHRQYSTRVTILRCQTHRKVNFDVAWFTQDIPNFYMSIILTWLQFPPTGQGSSTSESELTLQFWKYDPLSDLQGQLLFLASFLYPTTFFSPSSHWTTDISLDRISPWQIWDTFCTIPIFRGFK